MAAPASVSRRGWRAPTLGVAVGGTLAGAGLAVGMRPLADNSFFTHLATGRVVLETGSVPSTDPYTFSAPGVEWLVQSWLASWLYATVEAFAGAPGLRVLMGAIAAALTALAWRLTRAAPSLIPRLAVGVLFVAVGVGLWSERPLMLGLIAMVAAMMAAHDDLDPRWLVPIGWLWVNVHGSFPLGLVYLAVAAIGSRIDGRSAHTEVRSLTWLAVGVMAGAVGPLGPAVLTFPVELLQRQDVLQHVIEWQSPSFRSFSERAFLVQLALVIVALVRRPSARSGLLVAVFTAAALLGTRNISLASLVFLPLLAEAAPRWGTLESSVRSRVSAALAAVALAGAVMVGAVRLDQRDFDLRGYPVDALAYLQGNGVDLTTSRLAAPDVVGNVLELVYGPRGWVFYDDRFDMFPRKVSDAHLSLLRADSSMRDGLRRNGIDLVLWERSAATAQRLIADRDWRLLYSDERWVLTCRRGASLGAALARC